MFVEKLTNEELRDFLIMYKSCEEDVKIEFLHGFLYHVDNFVKYKGAKKESKLIAITDFKFDYITDVVWLRYLYSIFGKEYMNYYDEVALRFHKQIFE